MKRVDLRPIAVLGLVAASLLWGCTSVQPDSPVTAPPPAAETPAIDAASPASGPKPTPKPTVGAPVPGKPSRIWAVEPSGQAELLFTESRPLMVAGVSPDGRYILLAHQEGQSKGDIAATPYLWDRTTGQLSEGIRTGVRFARWSGQGFYVDWNAHLDLKLQETSHKQLPGLLDLRQGEREIIAISHAADGAGFAALVGHPRRGEPLDLILGRLDGTGLTVVPGALTGTETQLGVVAEVALSPNSEYLALVGKDGSTIIRTAEKDPKAWTWLKAGGFQVSWAPDSNHVWFREGGVFDRQGKPVFDPGRVHGLVWRPDGRGGAVYGYGARGPFLRTFQLDGTVVDLAVADYVVPVGFLPDGRLLVSRTITE